MVFGVLRLGRSFSQAYFNRQSIEKRKPNIDAVQKLIKKPTLKPIKSLMRTIK
jgi:hypothetical protein